MLFSSDTVASYINAAFEPVWESVRPVPIVTIDFGNGQKITRTLHGNIATYLCNAEGTVYDILPGIYDPDGYLKQLEQFTLLHRHARQQFGAKGTPTRLAERKEQLAAHIDARLKAYHEHQARLLKENKPADVLANKLNGGRGKALIEASVELIAAGEAGKPNQPIVQNTAPTPVPTKVAELPGWKELVEDTKINETVRRAMIHEKLAAGGRVKPEDIKKWLFKEVLAADLDDPTLGIGELLDKRYPFAEEDARSSRK